MTTTKSKNGVFWKREGERGLVYYWQIGPDKSKTMKCQTTCAMEYITRYVEKNPKYKDLVYDKTWDELFKMFKIKIASKG